MNIAFSINSKQLSQKGNPPLHQGKLEKNLERIMILSSGKVMNGTLCSSMTSGDLE